MSTSALFFSFLLPFSLFFLSVVYADVFVSIDCGSTAAEPYTDENLITWTGDQAYVRTGEPRNVPRNNSLSRVFDTLRAFTAASQKRNCYVITSVTKGRVLLRASFYYGNYDGKNKPPSFGLSFDGNHWATVTTAAGAIYHEATYTMKNESISVCVEQTNAGEFPFISAVEVRAVDGRLYGYVSAEFPLLLAERVAYGANSTIRYADDLYDRIWVPSDPPKPPLTTISTTPFLTISGDGDLPPPRIFQNAITPINPNATLNLSLPLQDNANVSVLLIMYFAEVLDNRTRSFQLYIDGKPQYIPILTLKGNFTEIYFFNHALPPNTSFSLVPLSNSTLPPLINALELFFIAPALTNGTYSNDVEGLDSIQGSFDVLKQWSGDPCLPSPYEWINCTSDSMPRVTALFLGGFNLSGKVPDFSSMDALETIDLHNNSLNGPIPDFLGALPKLKNLNLADNHFSGSVPNSLLQKNGLSLVLSGNTDLCTAGKPCASPTSSNGSTEKKNGLLIFGVTLQAIYFFSIFLHVF